MKIVKGIFRGYNGSLGYKTGEKYTLNVSRFTPEEEYVVYCLEHPPCVYSSIQTLEKNWTIEWEPKVKRIISDIDPYGEEDWNE